MTENIASPSATGPGGTRLEAKVGAFYLLAMLLGGEPRGLPGSRIARVQFQGATDDCPLDDVVLHAVTTTGEEATLDIQVKRRIAFSPSDQVFAKVCLQISQAMRLGKLEAICPYSMGIATAQSSRKIDGPYQEILEWARRSEGAGLFFHKLNQPKVASDDMRTFVATLRSRLLEFYGSSDDDTVWKVLRRLQILVFDFSSEGQSEVLARERCRQALDPDQQNKAGALWSTLIEIAQELASAAGEIMLPQLRLMIQEKSGLRLLPLRQNREALSVLAEASRHARESIRDHIADAHLTRRARLDLVNASFDQGRYVEILGDAGVGKSGVLRSLAEQVSSASNVIVLTPERLTPRGWSALRDEIGYRGSAANMLSELAASGGGIIFIDSVDMLSNEQRATVSDLVREAARIPGFYVVVTARRSFGSEEANWLPSEALQALGRAPPVVIDELSDDEVEELRTAAPRLVSLLAPGHPARDAVRNLFRLEWLFERGQQDLTPRTEAEMAQLWWRTGDGKPDSVSRDRTRVLRELAKQAVTGNLGPYIVSEYESQPLNALLKRGTLLEPKAEWVVFRHDVFRDWSVANLLTEEPAAYDMLPLKRLAPASLFRGVELAARLSLEGRSESTKWGAILKRLRLPGVHGSWQRAAILALVHSECSIEILDLAEAELLAERGALLRELVRTVMAVDSMPASQLFSKSSVELTAGLEDFPVPSGPSWHRLITWLLSLGRRLPGEAVEDVVKLYVAYAAAFYALDPMVETLVEKLHAWLMMIEGCQSRPENSSVPVVARDHFHALHTYLRSAFLAFCAKKTNLATRYLEFVLSDETAIRNSAESIVMSPGNAASAAPELVAQLTAKVLFPKSDQRRRGDFDISAPFTHADSKFILPAPTKGPFLALLNNAPPVGLALIRQTVQYASAFRRSQAANASSNEITIHLADGPRKFNDTGSYFWSRTGQNYCVTSALMALEAWSHQRMDRGDNVDSVLADILGDGEIPAAFLLLAVDVILSHWEKAWRAALAFVSSPELLAWDRSRPVHDQIVTNPALGDDSKPHGDSRAALQNRSSKRAMLERTLPFFAFNAPAEVLIELRDKLAEAAKRLGPFESHSDFGDPRFMACYALNCTDRHNYRKQDISDESGTTRAGHAYVSPPDEAAHLTSLQKARQTQHDDATRRAELSLALDDKTRSSLDLVARALPWAREVEESRAQQESFDNSVLITAYLLIRDGTTEQRSEHEIWALQRFEASVTLPEDGVYRVRSGLQFNPIGIATAGFVLHFTHTKKPQDMQRLLEIAARGDPAAARGFGKFGSELDAVELRLRKSLLRLAFAANVRPYLQRYGDDLSEDERRNAQVAEWRREALDKEWRWLTEGAEEPDWPRFPDPNVGRRARMIIGPRSRPQRTRADPDPKYYADHQAAGVWLQEFMGRNYVTPPWMREIAEHYRDWTGLLNGAGLEQNAELSHQPDGWNETYFTLVARSLGALDSRGIDNLCLNPIIDLPNQPFLDVMNNFILALDQVHFERQGPKDSETARIRAGLIERFRQTSQWRRYSRSPGYGVPFDLGGALGAAFMCHYGLGQPPQCYITAIGIPHAEIFSNMLLELAEATPSLFVAKAVLSIASVSSIHPFAALCIKTIEACMTAFPNDTRFWIDYNVGDEFCAWLDRSLDRFGIQFLREEELRLDVEGVLSSLIALGVSRAAPLELRIAVG